MLEDNRSINYHMEHTGFEPVTSTLPVWRAPSCANAPNTSATQMNAPHTAYAMRQAVA